MATEMAERRRPTDASSCELKIRALKPTRKDDDLSVNRASSPWFDQHIQRPSLSPTAHRSAIGSTALSGCRGDRSSGRSEKLILLLSYDGPPVRGRSESFLDIGQERFFNLCRFAEPMNCPSGQLGMPREPMDASVRSTMS